MLLLYCCVFLIRILILQREGKFIRLRKLTKLTRLTELLAKSSIISSKKVLAENCSDAALLLSLGHVPE